jgi:hypothetical protein
MNIIILIGVVFLFAFFGCMGAAVYFILTASAKMAGCALLAAFVSIIVCVVVGASIREDE